MRGPAVATFVAVMAGLLAPSGASAASITYRCGIDLCRVAADGGHDRRIARGTVAAPYHGLQNVRDSRLMAYERGQFVYLSRPDGRGARRFPLETHFSTDARGIMDHGANAGPYTCFSRVRAPARKQCWLGGVKIWWRTRALFGTAPHGFFRAVCLLKREGTGSDRNVYGCRSRIARPVGDVNFGSFDVSPDGRLAVVVTDPPGSDTQHLPHLALYDVRRGRRIRTLTGGHEDDVPSFSPDGRRIVFLRDDRSGWSPPGPLGQICVVPVAGGAARCVARGRDPVWTQD